MSAGNVEFRTDRVDLRPPERLPNGWLRADVHLTRVGVFEYRELPIDGRPRRELRPPEEVFDPESMASMAKLPVTDGHPMVNGKRVALDASNTRDFLRGYGGDTVQPDGEHLAGDVQIIDADLISRMETGVREASLGYSSLIDPTPGVWNGQPYDVVQRRIRGNHIAVVPVGRAGSAAFRWDAQGNPMAEATMAIKIGDVEYQLPPEALVALAAGASIEIGGTTFTVAKAGGEAPPPPKTDAEPTEEEKAKAAAASAGQQQRYDAELATLKSERVKDQAKIDHLTDKVTQLQAAQAGNPQAVRARLDLERKSRAVMGERFDAAPMTDDQLRAAVLSAINPARKAQYEKADSAYLQHRFDEAIEDFKPGERLSGELRMDAPAGTVDLEKSRRDMVKRLEGTHATAARAQQG